MFDPSTMSDDLRAQFGYPPLHPKPLPAFAKAEQPYSSLELASYKGARDLVAAINAKTFDFGQAAMVNGATLPPVRPMGGGVFAGDDEIASTEAPSAPLGIFAPQFSGLAARTETGADGTVYSELHMRFRNGCVMDVGLFLDKLSRLNSSLVSQSYALNYLANTVEQGALSA